MNSPADRIISNVASGHRLTVVKAPPGGGKSTLLAQVAGRLAHEYGLSLTVATPTRAQASGVALKLLDHLPAGHVQLRLSGVTNADLDPRWAVPVERLGVGYVSIRTLDSLRMSQSESGAARLLIVDEAFQASFALGASAARHFEQLVAVGDPGQIGPVVTMDVTPWSDLSSAPHLPFAQVLSTYPEADIVHLESTYRLGETTTSIVRHFYDFDFTSARPPVSSLLDGGSLPEVEAITSANVLETAVLRALDLTRSSVEGMADDGVAVLAALRSQAAMAGALLSRAGGESVRVGTADQLQGGQWSNVVVIDPIAEADISDHHLSLGRLCVLLSRHTSHLSFVTTPLWQLQLESMPDTAEHLELRRAILAA